MTSGLAWMLRGRREVKPPQPKPPQSKPPQPKILLALLMVLKNLVLPFTPQVQNKLFCNTCSLNILVLLT
jgi:hypothetical protein